MSDPPRSQETREFAEAALVRLVRAYGDTPEFVLLGGLVPDRLCTQTPRHHVGTTDVDVQVNLEIQSGAENARRLEEALEGSGFAPSVDYAWRWRHESSPGFVVKIEFLADLNDVANRRTVTFKGCTSLGAANLKGTGFASQDWELRPISTVLEEELVTVEVRVATLPAYLLAKVHAAYDRSLGKDWYDIAYVLLNNDDGGSVRAAQRVRERFSDELAGQTLTALDELLANFADADAQGCAAYAQTVNGLYPDQDRALLENDSIAAVAAFVNGLGVAPHAL